MQTPPTFNPNSPEAQAIAHLFLVVGVIMVAILALVTSLVLYASVRYRRRPGAGEPKQAFGKQKVEIAWTVGPILVIIFIFAITIQAMRRADPTPAPGEKPDMVIIAHQWWWEAHYTKSHVVTANEIHIPARKRLLVRLESRDVIHDWWVPQLGPKMDAIPGHPNHFWLEADQPGTYLGRCAEYCGAEHAWMRIRVIAQTAAEFNQWEQHQLEVPAKPGVGDAAQGAKLFLKSLTCANCHTVAGTAAKATIGPDLTHVASRETLAAGRLTNTPSNLQKWLANPQAIKPGSHMPNFELPDAQVHDLAAYMETLK
ncbi:MAG: cytochrome c oxidase subunit II [Terriglobia bacterium]